MSSGEAGLPELPAEEARRLREKEACAAAAILGVASISFLRQPDGQLQHRTDEAATALRPLLKQEQPELIYLASECDWHPDHRACLPIVGAALPHCDFPHPRLLCYEILTPLSEYDHVEDISVVLQRKLKAVLAHRS